MYTTEQIEKTLQTALNFTDKLRAVDFTEFSATKPAIDNYFKLLKDEYWQCEKTYAKVSNIIDGILIMKEYQLTTQLQKQN